MAAIHAADRSVLKEIMYTAPEAVKTSVSVASENTGSLTAQEGAQTMSSKKEIAVIEIQAYDGSADVAEELMRDLEKLNSSRHNFEMLLVEYSELKATPPKETKTIKPAPDSGQLAEPAKSSEPVKSTKSKRERIIELAKSKGVAGNSMKDRTKSQPSGKKKHHHADEVIIDEIQSSKKEIVPETPKQKEQIAIINQFIKTSPSISNAKDRLPAPTGDLNPIKSGEFGDNIVSETLVEILVKQGKKDKAIEVLKKLIWKYPQKKSYFASQIEDLKK